MNQASADPAIAVVGAGRMGRGIAIAFAYAGHDVALIDSEQRAPEAFADLAREVRAELHTELELLRDIGFITADQAEPMRRHISLHSRTECPPVLADAQFVFEAVLEVLEVKRSTYAWLNASASDTAVFASTTSTMFSDTLAAFVAGPQRYMNAHWLNPAYLIPLVEISPNRETDPGRVAALKNLLESIGKVPVVCAASSGYMVSRVQALALNEAARMVEEGVASAEDIDKAIRVGFGVRYATLGLLEFIDWGGGDILYYASKYLAENIDRHRYASPAIVEENMRQHRNGLRDGVGFYDYRGRDIDAYRRERLGAFVKLIKHLNLMPRRS